jgi:hypothetical protein
MMGDKDSAVIDANTLWIAEFLTKQQHFNRGLLENLNLGYYLGFKKKF